MRNSMMKLLMFLLFFSYESFAASSSDVEIKNHSLLGKTVYNPDYTLVVKGSNSSDNPQLITLEGRFYSGNFSDQNLDVEDVFKPETAFKVLKIYHHKAAIFTDGYDFAILEKENKKYVSPIIFQNEIAWKLNDCKKDRYCNYWRNAFVACDADKTCEILFGLGMRDENNKPIFSYEEKAKKSRPPYPQAWVENSMKSFRDYAKKHPEVKLDLNDIHLRVTAKDLTLKQLGDIFLHFEKLNIGDTIAVGVKSPTLSVSK